MTKILLNSTGHTTGRKIIWGLPESYSPSDWCDGHFWRASQTHSACTGDINSDPLDKAVFARFFYCEVTISPFPYLLEASHQVQPITRRGELTSTSGEWGGAEGVLKNFTKNLYVKITGATDKYLGWHILRLCKYPNCHPLILVFSSGSCLQQLLWVFMVIFSFSHYVYL